MRDLGDRQLGLAQQTLGAIDPALDNVMMRRESGRRLERVREVSRAHRQHFGDPIERQVFTQIFFDEFGCAPQLVDRQAVAVIGGGAVRDAIIAQQMDAELGRQCFGVRLARIGFGHRFAEQTLYELLDMRIARLKVVEQVRMALRRAAVLVDDALEERRRHAHGDELGLGLEAPVLRRTGRRDDDIAGAHRRAKLLAVAALVDIAGVAGHHRDRVIRALRDDVDVARPIELDGERGPSREVVLLNAGASLYMAGVVDSIQAGIAQAADELDSGRAKRKVEQVAAVSQRIKAETSNAVEVA